ncbi:MAG TPA: UDP-N-acetylmuramoyl-L-alanine--D-glutamate ligase, partial [Geobacteraceae bacterium]|nr:UDP-N-acetylmuramoyl-L-alanine--D-glutamate ligase [Geobacteraceae bacterium]
MELNNKKILVVGLARTGVAVARFLAEQGAQVTVTDMKDDAELAPWMAKLEDLSINYQLGQHDKHTFLMADMIVVSPGVPMDIKPLQLA